MRTISNLKKAAATVCAVVLISVVVLQILIAFPARSRAFGVESDAVAASSTASSGDTSIEADPPRLSGPGYVTIKIKLKNNSNTGSDGFNGFNEPEIEIESGNAGNTKSEPEKTEEPNDPTEPPVSGGSYTDVVVENDYGVTFNTGDVAPGETATFTGSMMITEDLLGQPLSFRLKWFDTGSQYLYSRDLSVTVSRVSGNTTHLTMNRTASTTHAAVGESVVLTYTLVNTGTVRINNIQVYDEKINGSSPIASAFSLSSGEMKELTFTYTMKEASVESKPRATFTAEGGSTVYSITCAKITIGLVNAQISKEIRPGEFTPEGVNLSLILTNNGSQSLHNLTVQDELGHILASNFSLAIGDSKYLEHFIPNPNNVRNVYFLITGTYADGKEFRDNTLTFPVYPYIDPELLGMTFTANVRKPLDSKNNISLVFTVKNTGQLVYTDVVLTESELGYNMYEIQTLYPDTEEETFQIDLQLDGPRELVFILTAVDPSGQTHTLKAFANAEYPDNAGAISDATDNTEANDALAIKNFDVDEVVTERITRYAKLWKIAAIIAIIALAVIATLGIFEIILYFRSKNKEQPEEMQ